MAMLQVTTASYKYRAAAGNKEPALVAVSVMDMNGKSVGGLSDISIGNVIMSGGYGLQLKSFAAQPGGCGLNVVPVQDNVWPTGTWVVCVFVVKGADQGQALATITVG